MKTLTFHALEHHEQETIVQHWKKYYQLVSQFYREIETEWWKHKSNIISPDIIFSNHDSGIIRYEPTIHRICFPINHTWEMEELLRIPMGIFVVIAHEFWHAFEETNHYSLSQKERERFADIFCGYVLRKYWLREDEFSQVIEIFLKLGKISEEWSIHNWIENIHGTSTQRVRYFLDGYMMTSISWGKFLKEIPRTKQELYKIHKQLLGIIQNSQSS